MSLFIQNATLTFPDGRDRLTALDKVSLGVADGELVALTGPSGSGKSSLLAVAGTLITPDSGTVRIGDKQVEDMSARERARIRREEVGFVFQADNLLPSLTAVEQLLLTVSMRGGKPAKHRGEAMALLEEVGMADSAERRPHELSGGMRQRVNIARAMMGTPSLLLIDEPTSALDSERSRAVITLIAELVRRRNLAAVLVSHDLESLAPGTPTGVDATVVITDGRIESVQSHLAAA
ncbi:ABC transporter ATP-binding protein [Tomitella biformata]|uniref:ABC transporter ATP-binding protein n=1 Tax=Tomitella biformata TaxID=630403 RepID=UPI000466315F|nr:ATP-binding cassette domain-containing protein [Tomitella biformata]